jgi:hypothetical protein
MLCALRLYYQIHMAPIVVPILNYMHLFS